MSRTAPSLVRACSTTKKRRKRFAPSCECNLRSVAAKDTMNYVIFTSWCNVDAARLDNELLSAVHTEITDLMMDVEKPNCRDDRAYPGGMFSYQDGAEHCATARCPGCHAVILQKNTSRKKGGKRLKDAEDTVNHFTTKMIENSEQVRKSRTFIDGGSLTVPTPPTV